LQPGRPPAAGSRPASTSRTAPPARLDHLARRMTEIPTISYEMLFTRNGNEVVGSRRPVDAPRWPAPSATR